MMHQTTKTYIKKMRSRFNFDKAIWQHSINKKTSQVEKNMHTKVYLKQLRVYHHYESFDTASDRNDQVWQLLVSHRLSR